MNKHSSRYKLPKHMTVARELERKFIKQVGAIKDVLLKHKDKDLKLKLDGFYEEDILRNPGDTPFVYEYVWCALGDTAYDTEGLFSVNLRGYSQVPATKSQKVVLCELYTIVDIHSRGILALDKKMNKVIPEICGACPDLRPARDYVREQGLYLTTDYKE